jgi:hypothetical protein
MQSADADKYRGMMIEVKARTYLIRNFAAAHPGVLPLPALAEFLYLHLRKLLELVAMGSLLANAKSFGLAEEKLKKYWNAKDLLSDLSAINPNFYPRPIIQKESSEPGVRMEWLDRDADYLTKDRFITLYDKCGGVLHARNPYRTEPDYASLIVEVPKWTTWIVNLLNAHTISLHGDPNLYLFQMGKEGRNPSYTPFAPKKSPNSERSASHQPTPDAG